MVVGVIALLLAIIISPLGLARRQALSARCAAQQKDLGISLAGAYDDFDYYPFWDDGGTPRRYTWVDVLVELRLLSNPRSAYCPEDPQPSALNSARAQYFGVLYPGTIAHFGIDYSYGIGAPLSAGGQSWRPGLGPAGDNRPRRFEHHDRNTAQRVLAGDAHWSHIYNLSGGTTLDWSYPSVYDNMAAYRHAGQSANFLFQDGHVTRVIYQPRSDTPVSTTTACLWYPGEPLRVGPEDEHNGNWYPDMPALGASGSAGIPSDINPRYYTDHGLWSQIFHK